jgi:biopolymer transport protein TolR
MWTGQSRWDKEAEPMGEINVTPLVDVMLVLLIIFMVTAPLLTQGVNVNQPLVLTVKRDGRIYLQRHEIRLSQLAPRIRAIRAQKPGLPVFIRGDARTPYENVARVLSTLEAANIQKVGLVTEPYRR